jgi:hypothetical protein
VYPVQMAQNNFHNKHKQRSFQNNSNFRKHFNKHDGEKKIFTKPNAAKPQFVKKVENQKSQIKCSRCNLSGHLATNRRVNLKRSLTTKVLTGIHTFTAFDKPVELLKINGTVNGIAANLYFAHFQSFG